MPTERFKSILAVFVILIENGNVFLMRRKNTGFRDGEYDLPSGHMEANESLRQAAIREAKEEAGVDIQLEDLRLTRVLDINANDGHRVDFFFVANRWDGIPRICEPEKCDDAQWFPLNSLPSNTIDHDRVAIENLTQQFSFDEKDW